MKTILVVSKYPQNWESAKTLFRVEEGYKLKLFAGLNELTDQDTGDLMLVECPVKQKYPCGGMDPARSHFLHAVACAGSHDIRQLVWGRSETPTIHFDGRPEWFETRDRFLDSFFPNWRKESLMVGSLTITMTVWAEWCEQITEVAPHEPPVREGIVWQIWRHHRLVLPE